MPGRAAAGTAAEVERSPTLAKRLIAVGSGLAWGVGTRAGFIVAVVPELPAAVVLTSVFTVVFTSVVTVVFTSVTAQWGSAEMLLST